MRVTVLTGSFPEMVCGVGDYTSRLVRQLAAAGLDVRVITTELPEIQICHSSNLSVHPVIPAWRLLYLYRLSCHLRASLPDLVHIQYPTRGYQKHLLINIYPIIHALLFPHLPLILTLHEFSLSHWLRKLSLIFLLSLANRIILPDERERTALVAWFPRLASRTAVIPIGANIEPRADKQDRPPPDVTDPYIVYFGFLTKAKDPETLLMAYKHLLQRRGDHRLLLVTEFLPGNRTHRRILRRIRQLGLTDRITITGYCHPDQVSRNLRGAAMCVLPFADGATLRHATLITALQHGLATVTTIRNEIPAGFENWHNIVLTPVGNPEDMAEALFTLLNDPMRRTAIARQAKTLGDRFAWPLIAQQHSYLYKQAQDTRVRERKAHCN